MRLQLDRLEARVDRNADRIETLCAQTNARLDLEIGKMNLRVDQEINSLGGKFEEVRRWQDKMDGSLRVGGIIFGFLMIFNTILTMASLLGFVHGSP
jgi:hypothetical protein